MQQLAKYAFVTKNKILPNDYFPWNKPLNSNEDCKIRHLLITLDCQLKKIKTVLGHVTFCQIVGVTEEELNASQSFNVKQVLEVLKQDPSTGGISLITDEERQRSVFDLFPNTLKQLKDNLEREGSDLAGINGEFFYRELPKIAIKTSLCLTMSDSGKSLDFTRHLGRLDIRTSAELSAHASSPFLPFARHVPVMLDGVEIIFTPNTAKFLELAFKYRLQKGHHFTFQNPDTHLTFVTENVSGCFVSSAQPYGLHGELLNYL
jgi:suppressor of fused-like protein